MEKNLVVGLATTHIPLKKTFDELKKKQLKEKNNNFQ